MAWDWHIARNDYVERTREQALGKGLAKSLLQVIDEDLSRRLLVEKVRLEKILLDGVPLDEGHSTVEEVAAKVYERAKRLTRGYVVAVVYTGTDDEVWIAGRNGRIAVAVNGQKKLHGHEALQLYRRARGDYIIMVGEDS